MPFKRLVKPKIGPHVEIVSNLCSWYQTFLAISKKYLLSYIRAFTYEMYFLAIRPATQLPLWTKSQLAHTFDAWTDLSTEIETLNPNQHLGATDTIDTPETCNAKKY